MMRIRVVGNNAFAEELAGAWAEMHDCEWSAEMRPGRDLRIVQILCPPECDPRMLMDDLRAVLARELSQEEMPRLALRPVRRDWELAWQRFFRGRMVAERFWIGPPWEETEIPDGLIPLVIDAGPAFGTGRHPTTELVLRLMTELDLAGARCLDAGTGSGVLAIAACRLGAEEVTAYDIDPAAIVRARSNASDNQVAPMIRFHACTVQNLPESGPWKYVFANMLPTQFAALACELHDLVEPDGRIIFSGILREVWADTLAFLEAENLVIERFIDDGKPEGGWAACLARLG